MAKRETPRKAVSPPITEEAPKVEAPVIEKPVVAPPVKEEKPEVLPKEENKIITKKISHNEAVALKAKGKLIGWNSITKMAKIKE